MQPLSSAFFLMGFHVVFLFWGRSVDQNAAGDEDPKRQNLIVNFLSRLIHHRRNA